MAALKHAGKFIGSVLLLAAVAACADQPLSTIDTPFDGDAPARSVSAPSEALRQDAALYAARYGVGIDEAVYRLSLQQPAGELNARLLAEHPATFAGLVIEHEPEFRVVALFTRGGEQALQGAGVDPRLAGVLRAERAAVPLRVLQTRLEAAYARVRGGGIEATGGLNLRQNRPEIYVLASRAAAARAALPPESGAAVVVVEELPKEEVALYGGLPLSTCTSGFTVQNSSGTLGITTAGHCGNSQSYAGYALTFLSEYDSGSYDIQWHNRSGSTYENKIKAGTGFRSITGTRTRANQVVGEWICKQGKTTGWTCGTLNNKSYCFDGACTWIYVTGGTVNLSEGGDSGGPWVNGEVAYGTHVFGGGNNSGYMAIDYLSGIGVSVLTTSPPASTGPTANISGYSTIKLAGNYTWQANAAGGNGTYTYQWEYRPDGGTWSNVGTGSSYSRWVDEYSPMSFELKVTVTSNGQTGFDTHWVNVIMPI